MAGRPSDSADPNNNGNNYSHPSLPIQDYTSYPSPSRMAAVLQTLSPEVSHFHNPSPMTPYPESVDLSSSGGFLYTTPQHQQQQSYMSSDLGVHMRSYNQDIRYYPTPLSNGPTETFNSFEDISRMIGDNFTGARDVAPSFDQPVTGPGGSESGNPHSHASGPWPRDLWCGWPGCSKRKPFSRKGDRDRHMRTLHFSPKSFLCKKCSKFFNRSDNRAAHIKRRHK